MEDYEEVLVYYSEDELNDYEPPDSWTDALRDTETAGDFYISLSPIIFLLFTTTKKNK